MNNSTKAPGLQPSHREMVVAQHAGELVVGNLQSLEDLAQVEPLFASIWGGGSSQTAMPVNLLVALVHAGGYVGGVLREGTLVAGAVGFLARREGVLELHSHVTGVTAELQGSGVGLALKEHQRGWARSQGIAAITWTFDPLSRRNGWFNLAKLGAQAVSYHPNFYGAMPDALNGNDETDRCMARLTTEEPLPSRTLDIASNGQARLALQVGVDEQPVTIGVDLDAPLIACQVPTDIVAIRRADPHLGRRWRLALRETMGTAMAEGYLAASISHDGYYQLLHPLLLGAPATSVLA